MNAPFFVKMRLWRMARAFPDHCFTYSFVYFQGWYIITYALGIYHLNLLIAFLSPRIDPALEELGKHDVSTVNCLL